MQNSLRSITSGLMLVSCLVLGSCGGETSKEEFLDQAVEVSTAATTDEEQASVRETFGCVYDKISDDSDLVSEFMDLKEGEDIPDGVSAKISTQMAECIVASGDPES